MEWNLDMGPNAVLFFSHSEVVSGCYLILALNIKGSGLLLGNVDSRKFSAERKRGKAVDPTRLCDAELSANSFFFLFLLNHSEAAAPSAFTKSGSTTIILAGFLLLNSNS